MVQSDGVRLPQRPHARRVVQAVDSQSIGHRHRLQAVAGVQTVLRMLAAPEDVAENLRFGIILVHSEDTVVLCRMPEPHSAKPQKCTVTLTTNGTNSHLLITS